MSCISDKEIRCSFCGTFYNPDDTNSRRRHDSICDPSVRKEKMNRMNNTLCGEVEESMRKYLEKKRQTERATREFQICTVGNEVLESQRAYGAYTPQILPFIVRGKEKERRQVHLQKKQRDIVRKRTMEEIVENDQQIFNDNDGEGSCSYNNVTKEYSVGSEFYGIKKSKDDATIDGAKKHSHFTRSSTARRQNISTLTPIQIGEIVIQEENSNSTSNVIERNGGATNVLQAAEEEVDSADEEDDDGSIKSYQSFIPRNKHAKCVSSSREEVTLGPFSEPNAFAYGTTSTSSSTSYTTNNNTTTVSTIDSASRMSNIGSGREVSTALLEHTNTCDGISIFRHHYSNKEKRYLELSSILSSINAPFHVYNKIIHWAQNTTAEELIYPISYKSLMKQVSVRTGLNETFPYQAILELPSGNFVKVTKFGFASQLKSLLCDKDLMNPKNLIRNGKFWEEPEMLSHVNDIETSQWYRDTIRLKCVHMNDMLIPIIFFIDKTHVKSKAVEPISFTLGKFKAVKQLLLPRILYHHMMKAEVEFFSIN